MFFNNLRDFKFLAIALGVLLTAVFAGPSTAAECKGMGQSKCEAASRCSWIKGYATKTGTKVKGYCRSKPSKSSAGQKKSAKSASVNTGTDKKGKTTKAGKTNSGTANKKAEKSDKKKKSTNKTSATSDNKREVSTKKTTSDNKGKSKKDKKSKDKTKSKKDKKSSDNK